MPVDVQYMTNTTGPDMIHGMVFVYGNRNYGRFLVRDYKINGTELYWSIERGSFLAVYFIDYNRTNMIMYGKDGHMYFANLTFDNGTTTNITYKRIF